MHLSLNEKEVKLLKQLIFLYIKNYELQLDPELEDVMLRLLYKLDFEWGD